MTDSVDEAYQARFEQEKQLLAEKGVPGLHPYQRQVDWYQDQWQAPRMFGMRSSQSSRAVPVRILAQEQDTIQPNRAARRKAARSKR